MNNSLIRLLVSLLINFLTLTAKIVTESELILSQNCSDHAVNKRSLGDKTRDRESHFEDHSDEYFTDPSVELNYLKYMAIVFKIDVYFVCAGTLISPYHVLTGAHCVINDRYVRTQPNKLSVRFGQRSIGLDQTANPVVMWFAHPSYKPETRQYDAAILEIKNRVVFSSTLAPVRLAALSFIDFLNKLVEIKADCVILGWEPDLTQQKNLIFNKYFIEKKRVNLKTWKECFTHVENIESTMVCTRPREVSEKCRGDSGGPLICSEGAQFGIATWNPGCIVPINKQDIFTRVDSVYQFIVLAMERQGKFWINEINDSENQDNVKNNSETRNEQEISLQKQEFRNIAADKSKSITFLLYLILHNCL